MLRAIRAVDGVRDFTGTLADYKDKKITIKLKDDKELTFDKKDTSYVKLDDFNMDDFNQEI
jgi:ribosome maturation factor RimP